MATEDMPEVPSTVSIPAKKAPIPTEQEPIKESIAERAEGSVRQDHVMEEQIEDAEEDDELLDLPAVPTSPVRPKKSKSKIRGNLVHRSPLQLPLLQVESWSGKLSRSLQLNMVF